MNRPPTGSVGSVLKRSKAVVGRPRMHSKEARGLRTIAFVVALFAATTLMADAFAPVGVPPVEVSPTPAAFDPSAPTGFFTENAAQVENAEILYSARRARAVRPRGPRGAPPRPHGPHRRGGAAPPGVVTPGASPHAGRLLSRGRP